MEPYDPRNDHYTVLGVPDRATPAEVKQVFREKVRLVHPDGHRETALACRELQRVNAAYAVLGDPVRRRAYDEARAAHRWRELEPAIDARIEAALAVATFTRKQRGKKTTTKVTVATARKPPRKPAAPVAAKPAGSPIPRPRRRVERGLFDVLAAHPCAELRDLEALLDATFDQLFTAPRRR